jgi:hypothetical protein
MDRDEKKQPKEYDKVFAKALDAAQDKPLPPSPEAEGSVAHGDDVPPPQYEEFADGSFSQAGPSTHTAPLQLPHGPKRLFFSNPYDSSTSLSASSSHVQLSNTAISPQVIFTPPAIVLDSPQNASSSRDEMSLPNPHSDHKSHVKTSSSSSMSTPMIVLGPPESMEDSSHTPMRMPSPNMPSFAPKPVHRSSDPIQGGHSLASSDPSRSDSLPLTPPTIYGIHGTSPSASSSDLYLARDLSLLNPQERPSSLARSSSSLASLAPSTALAEKYVISHFAHILFANDYLRASKWKPGSVKKATKQARIDILDTIRTVISSSPHEAAMVLVELREHANTHKLTLSAILQEPDPALEGMSAIYWSVAKLGRDAPHDRYTCAQAVLAAASPLTSDAENDVRSAVLVAGDQHAWTAIRSVANPWTGQEAMLMGDSGKVDHVEIIPDAKGDDAFTASFEIPLLRKRMKLAGKVSIDFLAHGEHIGTLGRCIANMLPLGRLFVLTVLEVPESGLPKRKGRPPVDKKKKLPDVGTWVFTLGLLEPSPDTPICARLLVDPAPRASSPLPVTETQRPIDLVLHPPQGWTLGHDVDTKKKTTDEVWVSVRECTFGRSLEAE